MSMTQELINLLQVEPLELNLFRGISGDIGSRAVFGGQVLGQALAAAARTVEEICAALMAAGVPVAPVRTIPEVAVDPHLWEREMLVKVDDPVAGEMYVPGVTIRLSATPGRIGPVPVPGEHTDAILRDVLGCDDLAIDALRRAGAVR